MSDIVRTEDQRRWAVIQGIATVFFVFFYGFQYINYFVWYRLNGSYVMYAGILFVVFYFYFMRAINVREIRIMLLYTLWMFISRLLNGDIYLENEFNLIYESTFLMVFMSTGLVLDAEKRKKMLMVISAGIGLYFAVVAVFVVLSAVFGTTYANPLCLDVDFVNMGYAKRAEVFGTNPNFCAAWFFLAFWLLVYLVTAIKNKLLAIAFGVAAVLNYLAFVFTYSRNIILAFSVTASLFIAAAVLRRFTGKKLPVRLGCMLLVFVLCVPVFYVGCGKTYDVLVDAGVAAQGEAASSSGVDAQPTAPPSQKELTSNRGFDDSGRLPIYKAAFKTFISNSSIMLKGGMQQNLMAEVNEQLPRNYAHPHNSLLFVALLLGLPGLVLAIAFWLCLVVRGIKLFFCENPEKKLEHVALLMPIIGMMMYSMLESCLFMSFDIRSILFMVFAGSLIAYEKEFCK